VAKIVIPSFRDYLRNQDSGITFSSVSFSFATFCKILIKDKRQGRRLLRLFFFFHHGVQEEHEEKKK